LLKFEDYQLLKRIGIVWQPCQPSPSFCARALPFLPAFSCSFGPIPGQYSQAKCIIQTSTILHTTLDESNDFHVAQEAHLLTLSALSMVLKKALLVLQELIKEAVLLVMVIAQVDGCLALDSLMCHSLQQESRANGWNGEGNQVPRERAERYRQLFSQDTGKIKRFSMCVCLYTRASYAARTRVHAHAQDKRQ
jgi:hypothetical protein